MKTKCHTVVQYTVRKLQDRFNGFRKNIKQHNV